MEFLFVALIFGGVVVAILAIMQGLAGIVNDLQKGVDEDAGDDG